MRRRLAAACVFLFAPSACVTITEPPDAGSLGEAPAYDEVEPSIDRAEAAQPFVGLKLEESFSGSLEAMEFARGLSVAGVAAGSPAEAAAIREGDRVLTADGVALFRVDQWNALLAARRPGESLRLAVERAGAIADVSLSVALRSAAGRPPATRFIERRKARCIVDTATLPHGAGAGTAARLVELAADSPLAAAGLRAGAVITAQDGVAIVSAADFARRVAALPFGTEVTLSVRDDSGERGEQVVRVELFSPSSHLTEITLWPLVSWRETADETKGGVTIVDLWLIWLFKREHDGATTRTSLLRFIAWETGGGALAEESTGAGWSEPASKPEPAR